jgi:outer membrane murein-binding lipoprotein Lpp
MSMAIIGVSVFAGSTLYQVSEGRKALDLQERIHTDAEARANLNAKNADIAMGKQNQKRPDITAAYDSNRRAAMVGGTMLTGANGVTDPAPIGKTTLLGS